jgi:hypothetical protein
LNYISQTKKKYYLGTLGNNFNNVEVTKTKEEKNQNEKSTTEMKLTGKKARKLRKKRTKTEKLQEVLEETLQKEKLQNWIFVEISKQ